MASFEFLYNDISQKKRLNQKMMHKLKKHSSCFLGLSKNYSIWLCDTYVERVDSVLDWQARGCVVAILTHGVHDSGHCSVGGIIASGKARAHLDLIIHISLFLFLIFISL